MIKSIFIAALYYTILSLFTSCNGQINSQVSSGILNNNNSDITIGETVEGLSEAIMVVYEDKKNNFWFGSSGQGAFRFDGKNLLQFTMKHGLVGNEILGIQEDTVGNIYFDTQDGVSKFDGQTFRTLTIGDSADSEWKLEPGDLWFKGNWNNNGPYRYDGKYLHHLEFPYNKRADELHANFPNMNWSPYGIYSLYTDSKGNTWFGTSNLGIYRYDGKSLKWMYEKHLTDKEKTGGSFGIRSILEDKDGKFWFCNTSYRYNILPGNRSEQGQTMLNYNREKGIENIKNPDGTDMVYFLSAVQDHNGNMWMATYSDGVWCYDGKKMNHYMVTNGSKEVKLFSIYKDNQDNIWLGTHEAGAFKFNGKAFEKFKY
ncbi:MAG: two-component regulator propeller domain-containing protein [Bacteroidota bacterium]